MSPLLPLVHNSAHSLASCVCLALVLPASLLAAPETATSDEVVLLPKYVVSDTRVLPPPEAWNYAKLPEMEVISTASVGNTRRFLRDFLVFEDAISLVWPALTEPSNQLTTHLVLCGADKNFALLMPQGKLDDADFQSAFFLQDKELCTIVVNLAPTEIHLGNDTLITDPYRAFRAEYVRFLIRRSMGLRPPEWFEEGLVQIVGTLNVDKRSIEFAHLDSGAQETGIVDTSKLTADQSDSSAKDPASSATLQQGGSFAGYLRQHALLPFKDFIVQKPAPGDETFGWQAQCFGFVHMCLYGRQKRYQGALLRFVDESAHGTAPTEESFKRCFGCSFKDMMVELRGYVDVSDHEYILMKTKKGQLLPEPPEVQVRAATDSESSRLKGEALRQGGHAEEAKNILIAPYLRGEKDPGLLATLGRSELALGEKDRARKFLEAAFQGKTEDVRACVELARLRLEEGLKQSHKLNRTQLDAVQAPLQWALTRNQPIPELYDLLVQSWLWAEPMPEKVELKVLIEGMNLYPRRPAYLYNCAQLCARAGLRREVEEIINMAINNVPTPEVKRRFEELRTQVPVIENAAKGAR